MRITIFTIGTEGDVRPLVALGVGLARRGHLVTVATDESCADLVTAHGLNHRPLSGDFRSWMLQDPNLHKRGLSTPAMAASFVNASGSWLETGRSRVSQPQPMRIY